jgi:hypothetical protein
MFEYIITYGWDQETAIHYAATLDDALTEATRRSTLQGVTGADLDWTTAAEPYDITRAYDLGLLDDESSDGWRDAWRAEAPWR